jgi:hypothetical protein
MTTACIDFPGFRVYTAVSGNPENHLNKEQQHLCHVPLILQSLTRRSSPAETIRGRVGWKDTQFTPRSWPSRTNFTTASVFPNISAWLGLARAIWSSNVMDVGAECFFRSPEISQMRTDWSRDAEAIRSSVGWNCAHIT